MATTTPLSTPASAPTQPTGSRSRSRFAVPASAVMAIVLLLVGGALTWAGVAQRGEGGFFTTQTARLVTATSALVTDEIDVDARRPANPGFDLGDLARVRIRATSARPDDAIFIGIGPAQQVDEYLRGTAYDEMASYEVNPFEVTYRRSSGGGRPAPPEAQHFWVASTTGTGGRSLEWDKRGGAWTAVAMNADGRPGINVTADLGLRFGFLFPLGIGLLACGALLVAATITVGQRTRRTRPPHRNTRID
jgi:hypothetical protein